MDHEPGYRPFPVEAVGLRYFVWRPAIEKPGRPVMGRRPYLGWLSYGIVAYGIGEVVYWDRGGFWQPFSNPKLRLNYWAEIPRPDEAGPVYEWQKSEGDGP